MLESDVMMREIDTFGRDAADDGQPPAMGPIPPGPSRARFSGS